jgi:integrase
MDILEEQKASFKMMFGRHPEASDLVFPSPHGKVYSDMALSKFMRDHKASSDTEGRTAVPHGFRTSFRGWATINEYPEHLIESCLAHEAKSKTIQAYKRENLIELRRPIMQAYADYIDNIS